MGLAWGGTRQAEAAHHGRGRRQQRQRYRGLRPNPAFLPALPWPCAAPQPRPGRQHCPHAPISVVWSCCGLEATHLPSITAPAGSALLRCWEPTWQGAAGAAPAAAVERSDKLQRLHATTCWRGQAPGSDAAWSTQQAGIEVTVPAASRRMRPPGGAPYLGLAPLFQRVHDGDDVLGRKVLVIVVREAVDALRRRAKAKCKGRLLTRSAGNFSVQRMIRYTCTVLPACAAIVAKPGGQNSAPCSTQGRSSNVARHAAASIAALSPEQFGAAGNAGGKTARSPHGRPQHALAALPAAPAVRAAPTQRAQHAPWCSLPRQSWGR